MAAEYREKSFGHVLRDLGASASELIHNEITLIKSEVEVAGDRLARHATELAVWGGLLALSTIPFLAFLVIGLGRWLDDRYWLSSLIVALVCAGLGGAFTWRKIKAIKAEDLRLQRSKESLEAGTKIVKNKIQDVRDAAKGELQ